MILQSVVALVTEGKEENLTTGKIAERAGVSVGSVYQYFPGKEAIFSSLIEWHLKKSLEDFRTALGSIGEKSLSEAVSQMVDSNFEVRRKNAVMDRALLKFFSRFGDLELLNKNDALLVQEVEKILDKAAGTGMIRKGNTTAFILVHAIRSTLLVTTLQRPEFYQNDELRNELKRMIIGILTPALGQ